MVSIHLLCFPLHVCVCASVYLNHTIFTSLVQQFLPRNRRWAASYMMRARFCNFFFNFCLSSIFFIFAWCQTKNHRRFIVFPIFCLFGNLCVSLFLFCCEFISSLSRTSSSATTLMWTVNYKFKLPTINHAKAYCWDKRLVASRFFFI